MRLNLLDPRPRLSLAVHSKRSAPAGGNLRGAIEVGTIMQNSGVSIVLETNINPAKLLNKTTRARTIRAQRFTKVVSTVAH